ncbi:hypothetical protein H1R20_g6962, partial [Candolleomyces eurysporus]
MSLSLLVWASKSVFELGMISASSLSLTTAVNMAQDLPTNPPSKLDGEHYWDFVTFSVEGCLFRLPKYRFVEESKDFWKGYQFDPDNELVPQAAEEPEYTNVTINADTSSSPNLDQGQHVISLNDVTVDDFRYFLKWQSVLKLSTTWSFNDIRHQAIKEIEAGDGGMTAVNQIILAKEYNVSEWLLTGYKTLITREETIDLQEGEEIGLRNALQLYELRDQYFRQGWLEETLESEIQCKFELELDIMREIEGKYPTKKERKAAEDAKAKSDQEERARAQQKAKLLIEQAESRKKAVEECERGIEIKRQELAQMEKEKEALLAPPPIGPSPEDRRAAKMARKAARKEKARSYKTVTDTACDPTPEVVDPCVPSILGSKPMVEILEMPA